ncbi:hypothetical protein OS493_013148 [Desmophyllum pertusum]|uniref:Uncharacterized protein n=1 Tax=Desmophyllum pertusum TaxID=174260 RepID=A0A9W9YT56_9CNID|nr:hypothetical protein OS493_013148 [Desmophyllum pertusum]
MSEKDTIIRQRLIELERKHAKALRKLQRAEKSKQRRQTFHGYTVKDENIDSSDAQNRSASILLSQEVFTPDDRKSSSLSAHKKGLCNKSVTFKDAEIENPSIKTIAKENRHSSDHTCNSVDAFTKESLGSPNEDADVKVEKEDSGSCSSLRGSDNLPSKTVRWLQLFEEEFPRRSPRLRSTPNFGCQAVVSQDNNNVMQSRGKNQQDQNKIKNKERNHIMWPSSEQTKNGGSLSVVVDFSLPDKDFAKLKLTKIKSALPVERLDRVANGKSEKTTDEHASMVDGDNILSELKCEDEMKGRLFSAIC